MSTSPSTDCSTREETILTAALRLFEQHGYRKVSMSDVARAAQISRPTLYAAFSNKEMIFAALVEKHRDHSLAATAKLILKRLTLKKKLAAVFDIWIIEPVASVMGSPNATDLIANCAVYAPSAVADLYHQFELQLVAVLKPAVHKDSALGADDLAYILRLATTSLKVSTENEARLRQLVAGLIAMTLSTVEARPAAP